MLAPTSRGRPRLAHIEGLRAVAVLAVVGTHLALLSGFTAEHALGPLTARLNVGVALFFVLSAYLLYRPWVDARLNGARAVDAGRYATRRLVRIFPAYLLALIVLGLLIPDQAPGVFGGDWWAYFGLLQVYSQDTVVGGLGVTWSLSTELAFYLALPLIGWGAAQLLGGRPRALQVRIELAALAASVAVAFLLRHVVAEHGWVKTYANTIGGKWPWFAVGLALAVASAAWGTRPFEERPRVVRFGPGGAWACWATAAALLLFSAYGGVLPRNAFALTPAQSQLELLLFALFGLCLVAPVVLGDASAPRSPAALLALAPVVWLGTISYGIFLWHYPLAWWASGEIPDDAWLFAAVACALTLACAAVSWYVIEQPLLRRTIGRGRSRAALAAAEAREPAP